MLESLVCILVIFLLIFVLLIVIVKTLKGQRLKLNLHIGSTKRNVKVEIDTFPLESKSKSE